MNAPRMPRCALDRIQIKPMDTYEIKREGFHIQRILVVNLDDPKLNWMEQQVLTQVGNKLYGKGKQ